MAEILAIGGHPDDSEQFSGGTLALLQEAGHNITIAALTDGACGSHQLSAEEIVRLRLDESKKAAAKLGAEFINLGVADGSLEYNLENAKKVASLLRRIQPDVVFTHPSKDDYMTDHWHTGALVMWAMPEAEHKNFVAEGDILKKRPHVYHWDPQGLTFSDGQIARVNTIVDISETIEKKLDAFSTHESQMDFLPGKISTVEKTRRWSIIRGEQVRVLNGEGFMQELNAQYPRNNILTELLPGKVYTL